MEKKLKPFDLEAALKGAEVVTRTGKEVTEIVVLKTVIYGRNVLAVINGNLYSFNQNGRVDGDVEYPNDLFMKPQQLNKWVNLYRCNSFVFRTGVAMYNTEQEAKEAVDDINFNSDYLKSIQITFEA